MKFCKFFMNTFGIAFENKTNPILTKAANNRAQGTDFKPHKSY